MSDSDATPERRRSGTTFVLIALAGMAALLAFLLLVSPRLQARMGLGEDAVGFTPPSAPVSAPLTLDGDRVGEARWDDAGVCAEVTVGPEGTYRVCARPDPLRPIWAIDAPDEAAVPFLLLAVPPDVGTVSGTTTDGEIFTGVAQTDLPARWILIPLPEGAVVDRIEVTGTDTDDLGTARCGAIEAPPGGPDRLGGGCLLPSED